MSRACCVDIRIGCSSNKDMLQTPDCICKLAEGHRVIYCIVGSYQDTNKHASSTNRLGTAPRPRRFGRSRRPAKVANLRCVTHHTLVVAKVPVVTHQGEGGTLHGGTVFFISTPSIMMIYIKMHGTIWVQTRFGNAVSASIENSNSL